MSMPVIKPSTVTLAGAITDIIESVALEQTGLSHIINAEGEKIQAVVAMPGVTSEQLLAVNSSVRETLGAITLLETVLASKLEIFRTFINK